MNRYVYLIKKNILVIKTILICVFIGVLFLKLKDHTWDYSNLKFNFLPFLFFLVIIPFNWYLEWTKWKIITAFNGLIEKEINLKAFASGMISSFLTPSLSGNFIGRIFYYPLRYRVKLATQIFIANGSQFLVAICIGLVSFINVFQETPNAMVLMLIATIILFYVYANTLIHLLNNNYLNKLEPFILTVNIRLKFLFLSVLRYTVFIFQYLLVLWTFGLEPSIEVFQLILIVFLFVTISPSIFFGKILLRESIAIGVFSLYNYDINIIAISSLSIWLFSIFIPSLFSILLIEKSKNHAYA